MARRTFPTVPRSQSALEEILSEYVQWLNEQIVLKDPTNYHGTSNLEKAKLFHEHQALLKAEAMLEAIIKTHQPAHGGIPE